MTIAILPCRICGQAPSVEDGWISAGHGGGPGNRTIRCHRCHYSTDANEWSEGPAFKEVAVFRWNKLQRRAE